MKDNSKDHTHLRLIKSKSDASDKLSTRSNMTASTVIKKKDSALSRLRAWLAWKDITLRQAFLPILTLGFLVSVCIFYIWAAFLSFQ
jgi:hypothetical protein